MLLAGTLTFGNLLLSGCQTAGNAGLRVLNLIGITQKPLAVGLTPENQAAPALNVVDSLNPFPPYDPLTKALGDAIGRPVGVEPCFPLQVEFGLESGWYDLAVVTPAHFAALPRRERFPVIAVSCDERRRPARPAVLIVPADSEVRAISDLRGKSIAFGPAEDALLHYAALELLARNDLKPADLWLEIIPVPGSLKHLPDGKAISESVGKRLSAAGFVDLPTWESLPETSAAGAMFSRDQFRVVGETMALPRRVFLRAPGLDAATTDKIVRFLVDVHESKPDVLKPLKIGGYARPTPEILEACARLSRHARPTEPLLEMPATSAPAANGH